MRERENLLKISPRQKLAASLVKTCSNFHQCKKTIVRPVQFLLTTIRTSDTCKFIVSIKNLSENIRQDAKHTAWFQYSVHLQVDFLFPETMKDSSKS